jgi:type IV pilus assembly protein PilA
MSMIDRCRKRRLHGEDDEGFTLIELLVVLLIIGILLAIAIPTFLSITKGANGTAAQSNLKTALTGADTYYTDGNQSYTDMVNSASYSNVDQMSLGVSFVTASSSSTGAHDISYDVVNGSALTLAAFAPGQSDCWGIIDLKSTQGGAVGGETAVGTYYAVIKNSSKTTCTASAFASPTLTGAQGSGFPAG